MVNSSINDITITIYIYIYIYIGCNRYRGDDKYKIFGFFYTYFSQIFLVFILDISITLN